MSFKNANKFGKGSATLATANEETFAGDTDVDPDTDLITVTGHSLATGDCYRLSGGTAPVGLVLGNVYFVIVVDANTIKLASSYRNALDGTAIDITLVGAATVTMTEVFLVKFPRQARVVGFSVLGTNMLIRTCHDSHAAVQLWVPWAAGAVSTLTAATFENGFDAVEIQGVGNYSYNWD